MKKTKTREALEFSKAINELLDDWVPYINTIIVDNGNEFAEHKSIVETSQVDFYFADPYCCWQRGANENLKKTDFELITDQQVLYVQK